ncbi:hypothetical protein SISNIDRAFT_549661 [Sistotremastrum niveocremeum HHB9708]|uniref:Maintenance of telomere capping protein 1 n=1 Tax=Sistotremastrum niveocremeum HHB9708 TaxID=1314777 RepID=A0A164UIT6_9AGAM|nr:hypothetical protein SISNIDRAFT_549661 [Sistotremastrum niveocremeum HHB9708]
MAKPSSKQQEALQFLDDLDSISAPILPTDSKISSKLSSSTELPSSGQAADVLAFLDEVTQKSSEPTKSAASRITISRPSSRASNATPPLLKKTTDHTRASVQPQSATHPPSHAAASSVVNETSNQVPPNPTNTTSSWGWSVWSSASAALQQARSVVDDQVKNLPNNEHAKKWGEGVMGIVKNVQLDQISQELKQRSMSTLTDLLNAVAPPISEHEVIQLWLSHDMQGYDGIETLVYRALAKVMEQVEGGDLVVNRGDESKPKDSSAARNINAAEDFDSALKLSRANLDEIMKNKKPSGSTSQKSEHNPTTYSSVYLRVQPFFSSQLSSLSPRPSTDPSSMPPTRHLQFLLHIMDPGHELTHTTVTQALPEIWFDLLDDHEWVEDVIVDSLRVGVEVLCQEYVVARMGWANTQPAKDQVNAEPNDSAKDSVQS